MTPSAFPSGMPTLQVTVPLVTLTRKNHSSSQSFSENW